MPNPNEFKTNKRRSIRIQEFDYAQPGVYFITVCTYKRQCTLGEINHCEMFLNALGRIVQEEWNKTAVIRSNVSLDSFVIMPNHLHRILLIHESNEPLAIERENALQGRGTLQCAPTTNRLPSTERFGRSTCNSIPTIVRLFKASSTRRINILRGKMGAPVWQRNYYEHVIRDEIELNRIRRYIDANPFNWHEDRENP